MGKLVMATLSPYLVPTLVIIKVSLPICRMKRHLLYCGENLMIGNIAIIKEFLPKCRFISINAFLQECRVPSSSARVYFKVRSKVAQRFESNNSYLCISRFGHIFACPASWRCPLYLFPFSMVLMF